MAKKSTKTKTRKVERAEVSPPAWLITAANAPLEQAKTGGRAITIEDLFAWELPGNPQVSPDASKIVYEVLGIDKEKDDYRSALWLIDGDAEPRKLTSGQAKDTSPAWSPDGSQIAFLSDRAEKNQIFVLPLDGGEARQVTTLETGVGQFEWSPDGSKFAFTSRIPPRKEGDSDVKVITSAYYKFDGMGFIDIRDRIWQPAGKEGSKS